MMNFDLADLDDCSASELIQQLLSQLDQAREAAQQWERRTIGIRKMIDAVVEMYPAAEDELPADLDDDDEPRPRGAEAVLRVLSQRRGKWYTVPIVVGFLEGAGWLPQSSNPANAVRTALERLVERGEVSKSRSTDGAVIYQVPVPNEPPDYGDDEEPF